MLRHVALIRTHVLEDHSTSIIRVTRIGELVTTLAVTSNRHTLVGSHTSDALPQPTTTPALIGNHRLPILHWGYRVTAASTLKAAARTEPLMVLTLKG
jgi:hypothetical protein